MDAAYLFSLILRKTQFYSRWLSQIEICRHAFRIFFASALAISVFGFVIVFSVTSNAQQIFEFYNGVRQLGMGGAYAAVVNDETALLTNPAGLSKVRGHIITPADLELSFGQNTTDIATASTYGAVLNPQGLLDALNGQKGKQFFARAQVFPSAIFSNFGFGLHYKYQVDGLVDSLGTTYRLDYTNDLAAVLGFSVRFFDGLVKLGVTARAVDRVEVAKSLPATSTGLTLATQASSGMGVGSDLGLILSAPVATLPSLAIVVRDVGHTTYGLSGGTQLSTLTRPRVTEQTIDAGLAIFPILSNRTRMTLTLDYHSINTMAKDTENGGKFDLWRRAHIGSELNFSDVFYLRAGANQRYWTAGFELATSKFQIQGASYGEEIGTALSPKEDRRYVGKLLFRF
jgi:hypothetical protein